VRLGRIGVVAVLVLLLISRAPADAQNPVVVYAHRGGAGLAPENTLGAFRQAQAMFGAEGVWLEMDTQLTADGQLVVMHDDTVDRTTTCSGAVNALTLAQLAPCDASKSFPGWPTFEPIPTLREVLLEGVASGWRLMIEIKDIPGESNFDALGTKVADALVALLAETGFPSDRVIIQSFWPLALDRVESRAPALRTMLLTSSTLPGLPVGIPASLNMAYSTLRSYDISAPDIRTIDMYPAIVGLGHALGRQVITWTPDTAADIDHAIALGVDGVISNRPDLVYAALSP
jgi:glycerophosphoryl diester phosphodiesterase